VFGGLILAGKSAWAGYILVPWELEKFVRLALKANPNVLETLWTPLVLLADEAAKELRAMRQAFLSKHLYKTYSGYVLSQFRRMANAYKETLAERSVYRPRTGRSCPINLGGLNSATGSGMVRGWAVPGDPLLPVSGGGSTFDRWQTARGSTPIQITGSIS